MPSIIKTVTWDCADVLAMAQFWAAALGSDVDEDSTPVKAYVEAAGWGAPNMWFNQVPEAKCYEQRTARLRRGPSGSAGRWPGPPPLTLAPDTGSAGTIVGAGEVSW
jgi:hypothetical protein